MSQDTKRVPILGILGALLVVVVAGTAVGIDWDELAKQVFKERHQGKQVCFEVRTRPPSRLSVSWHIGPHGDTFERHLRDWDRCEPAETGEPYGLLAEKVGPATTTTCRVYVLPGSEELRRDVKAGTGNCGVTGVVP